MLLSSFSRALKSSCFISALIFWSKKYNNMSMYTPSVSDSKCLQRDAISLIYPIPFQRLWCNLVLLWCLVASFNSFAGSAKQQWVSELYVFNRASYSTSMEFKAYFLVPSYVLILFLRARHREISNTWPCTSLSDRWEDYVEKQIARKYEICKNLMRVREG